MSAITITLTKRCLRCKAEKNRNDDFYQNAGQPDCKDFYCKQCRRLQINESKARTGYKCKWNPDTQKEYHKERRLRMNGIPDQEITDEQIEELKIWLSHPEAWEGISAFRKKQIKCGLRKCLMNMKYESQWFPKK